MSVPNRLGQELVENLSRSSGVLDDLGIIIVTFNSGEDIQGCLETLGPNAFSRVIVVDNASTDDTCDRVRRFPVRLMPLPTNSGLSRATNLALSTMQGRDVLLLNPDVRIAFDQVLSMQEKAKAINAGILGPRLLYSDGRLQQTSFDFPTLVQIARRRARRVVDETHKQGAGRGLLGEVDWVLGAALFISAVCLLDLGGMNPKFFLYCEDTELCSRAWQVGHTVVYDPSITAVHAYARGSSRTFDFRNASTRHHWRSLIRLFRMYPGQMLGLRPGPRRQVAWVPPHPTGQRRMKTK